MWQQQGPNSDPQSHECRTFPLGHYDFLRRKLAFAQSIYSLNLEIAHSGPALDRQFQRWQNCVHDKWRTSPKYLDVVWGVANCNTTWKKFPRLHLISMTSAAKFCRNLLNIICFTTLHCGGLDSRSVTSFQVFELIITNHLIHDERNISMPVHFQKLCKTLKCKSLNFCLYWQITWFR